MSRDIDDILARIRDELKAAPAMQSPEMQSPEMQSPEMQPGRTPAQPQVSAASSARVRARDVLQGAFVRASAPVARRAFGWYLDQLAKLHVRELELMQALLDDAERHGQRRERVREVLTRHADRRHKA